MVFGPFCSQIVPKFVFEREPRMTAVMTGRVVRVPARNGGTVLIRNPRLVAMRLRLIPNLKKEIYAIVEGIKLLERIRARIDVPTIGPAPYSEWDKALLMARAECEYRSGLLEGDVYWLCDRLGEIAEAIDSAVVLETIPSWPRRQKPGKGCA